MSEASPPNPSGLIGSTHPLGGDLYTPVNEQVVELLNSMRDHLGTWRDVSGVSGTRLKVLRRMRNGTGRKTISMSLMDRLITTTGVGDLRDFIWFTAEDLIALGVWDKPADPVEGTPKEWREKRKRY